MEYLRALRRVGLWNFTRSVLREIGEDQITTQAAALAYSWIFSIFPFIIFLLTLIAFVPYANRPENVNALKQRITHVLPQQGGRIINHVVGEVMESRHMGILSIGAILTLWSASSGVAMIMSALNRCYDIQKDRPFILHRLFALLLTFVVIVLIILIIVLLPVAGSALDWVLGHSEMLAKYYPFTRWPGLLSWPVKMAADIARWGLATLAMLLLIAVVYRFGPTNQRRLQIFSPGAIFTLTVWVLLGIAFNFYVSHFAKYSATYGPMGGVIVVLLSFYLDAVVLLVGAEINSEFDLAIYRHKSEGRIEDSPTA